MVYLEQTFCKIVYCATVSMLDFQVKYIKFSFYIATHCEEQIKTPIFHTANFVVKYEKRLCSHAACEVSVEMST